MQRYMTSQLDVQ